MNNELDKRKAARGVLPPARGVLPPAQIVLVLGHGMGVNCEYLNSPRNMRLTNRKLIENARVDSLEAEYNLIAQKKSKLPAASRKQLVAHYEFYHKDKRGRHNERYGFNKH